MSREHPTPAEDALHNLSTTLHILRAADVELVRDPAPKLVDLYLHAAIGMQLAVGLRDLVDHLGTKVRAYTPVTADGTDCAERMPEANRQINIARVAFHQAHEALHAAAAQLDVMVDRSEHPVNG